MVMKNYQNDSDKRILITLNNPFRLNVQDSTEKNKIEYKKQARFFPRLQFETEEHKNDPYYY